MSTLPRQPRSSGTTLETARSALPQNCKWFEVTVRGGAGQEGHESPGAACLEESQNGTRHSRRWRGGWSGLPRGVKRHSSQRMLRGSRERGAEGCCSYKEATRMLLAGGGTTRLLTQLQRDGEARASAHELLLDPSSSPAQPQLADEGCSKVDRRCCWLWGGRMLQDAHPKSTGCPAQSGAEGRPHSIRTKAPYGLNGPCQDLTQVRPTAAATG